MSDRFDVAVIGAGPAGLAAAVNASEMGLRVVLIDAGIQPGGQYWRHPDEKHPVDDESHGHHGWAVFSDLRERLHMQQQGGNVVYHPRSQVWLIEHQSENAAFWVLHLNGVTDRTEPIGAARTIRAQRLILCPGGYDRQLPIPGWDLPGTMAAGGVQALLKGHRSLAGRRVLVAGTGPFLLPVAAGLADAGAKIVGVCEASNLTGWVRNIASAAQVPSKAIEGAKYVSSLLRHRIPYLTRTAVTAISGTNSVESVTISKLTADGGPITGTERIVDVDLVALGWGFTPAMELVLAVGAETRQDVDESLVAVVDDNQRSTVDRVYIAGEATGVGGALMSVAEGRLAALAAAADTGIDVDPARVRTLQSIIRRSAAFAHAMHRAHPVPKNWHEWLTPETIVCRCEEVSYGEICHAGEELDVHDARTIKLTVRPGMGWCQGRICGFATAKIAAAKQHRTVGAADLVPISKRPFAAPVALADLAADND